MKRKGLFLVTLILAICMVSQTMVLAAWEPYYGEQQTTGYAVRVQKSWNDAGQTVYTAYNAYGNVVLDIRARDGNIWNETTQVLCTSTNKGPEFVGISEELDVYGVNGNWNPMMYRNGFQSGEVPYVISDVYVTSYYTNNKAGFYTNSNGITIGVYTNNGVYNFEEDNLVSGNNISFNSAYPKVVQNGNDYYYYYNSDRYYTYKYNPNTGKLSYNSSSISSISEIAFAPGYLFAVTTSNKVYQIRIGSLQKEETYNDYFQEWIYQDDDSYWVIGYVGNYNEPHYFNIDNSWNNNWNNGWDNSQYYDYPRITQNGNEYSYRVSENWSYTYTLSNTGKLSYGNTTIDYDVEQVEFSNGYLVYVNEDQEVYKVRVGETYKIRVCYDFREFYYDDAGLVYKVVSYNGTYDV